MVASSQHKEKRQLILARFEPWFLEELMKIWPDREKGKVGLTQGRLAQLCKLSQRAVAYYLSGERYPDSESLRKMGEFFGLHFVEDWDNSIDMQALLKRLKALNASI